ncbi:hypothetical protein GYMLUDRAFT_48684 [Collybiopsis luxurians FD-317 M1]|uniref:Cytokinin riboside 5'-monophosphate phosphoribohydrolase n=1 Tax=Collybiopsis luxurians FD-317 M1 TaxID=944289 RepID=A0A0D0C9C1_9AGAR|nr:hypothetical protein GYMLUDRAFT_48684 [Collybiopsis luxurians FD-317 M1]
MYCPADPEPRAVAVYCGSSIGKRAAYAKAALSVGAALAKNNRPLVYGGGSNGIMGTVSKAVIDNGGSVTGFIPHAMLEAGGEADKSAQPQPSASDNKRLVQLHPDTENYRTIIVDTMHDRKVAMARHSCGFVGLPGGFGTFEEVFEVTTWTQLGIHDKPIVLLNVLNYYDPIRQMILRAIEDGFIQPFNVKLITFVDGPEDLELHEQYDWGTAALKAIEGWKKGEHKAFYDWSKRMNGNLASS